MTAKELINFLSKLDPETRIFTRGYEGGFDDVSKTLTVEDYVLNVNREWYYGSHGKLNKDEKLPKEKEVVKGVCL